MEMFFLKNSFYQPKVEEIEDIVNSAKLAESLIEKNFAAE